MNNEQRMDGWMDEIVSVSSVEQGILTEDRGSLPHFRPQALEQVMPLSESASSSNKNNHRNTYKYE